MIGIKIIYLKNEKMKKCMELMFVYNRSINGKTNFVCKVKIFI